MYKRNSVASTIIRGPPNFGQVIPVAKGASISNAQVGWPQWKVTKLSGSETLELASESQRLTLGYHAVLQNSLTDPAIQDAHARKFLN